MDLEKPQHHHQSPNAPPNGDNTNGVDSKITLLSTSSVDGGDKTPRLPRWTRQEILVLIQGKKVAENRVRRGRTGNQIGSSQIEPKWAAVSSYCKRHGVNRGPVQCRKRWSNLAGDYKKIKEWEMRIGDETESFWVMRNDLRRERKLPGFFDREVYDILDGVGGGGDGGGGTGGVGPVLDLVLAPAGGGMEVEETEVVFDSGRSAAAEDGLFSDFEEGSRSPVERVVVKEVPPLTAVGEGVSVTGSEKEFGQNRRECQTEGITNEKRPASNPEMGSGSGLGAQDGCKRKRLTTDVDDETNVQKQLIEILDRNSKLLTAQLESQKANSQIEREQRKEHECGLLEVLNKLADALGKIADKL